MFNALVISEEGRIVVRSCGVRCLDSPETLLYAFIDQFRRVNTQTDKRQAHDQVGILLKGFPHLAIRNMAKVLSSRAKTDTINAHAGKFIQQFRQKTFLARIMRMEINDHLVYLLPSAMLVKCCFRFRYDEFES